MAFYVSLTRGLKELLIQFMVDVVQLVERQFVVLIVAGSSPVIHPFLWAASSAGRATDS